MTANTEHGFADRTAIVTGGANGIGREIVEQFATQGATVVVADVEDGPEFGNDLDERVHPVETDVTDEAAVADLAETALAEFGSIDVLVNNAAIFFQTSLLKMTPEQIETTLSVNMGGTIYCTRAVLASMLERGGKIITIASLAGTRGSPTDPVYGAAKGGMVSFTRSLARQYTDEGVFSNVVAPGPTDTEMFPKERRPAVRERSPIDRLIAPEEIADAVRFFAETECISGRVLEIGGGLA